MLIRKFALGMQAWPVLSKLSVSQPVSLNGWVVLLFADLTLTSVWKPRSQVKLDSSLKKLSKPWINVFPRWLRNARDMTFWESCSFVCFDVITLTIWLSILATHGFYLAKLEPTSYCSSFYTVVGHRGKGNFSHHCFNALPLSCCCFSSFTMPPPKLLNFVLTRS